MLDGKIGYAAAGVDTMWCNDRLGGACGDAAGTLAAMITKGRIGDERQRREQLGKEKPSSEFAMNLYRALAVPAKAGIGGKIAF